MAKPVEYSACVRCQSEAGAGKSGQFAVGLISGTSMDGIDACVVEITEEGAAGAADLQQLKLNLLGFLTHPYPDELKVDLHRLCTAGSTAEVCLYNALLGKMFARAAQLVVEQCGLSMQDVAVIGSHGQTIHHLPAPQHLHGFNVASTLQIGDPSFIAHECRVTTVGDFRPADMAVGGQGAPLVPYLDRILLERHFVKTRRLGLLLNVGGISNISGYIPSSANSNENGAFIGFDCGPGNVLIDSLMKQWFGEDFDKDGEMAAEGSVSDQLLRRLMEDDEYIRRPPPKSTGREYYNEKYVNDIMAMCKELGISKEDGVATVTEFTAAAVLINFELFLQSTMIVRGNKKDGSLSPPCVSSVTHSEPVEPRQLLLGNHGDDGWDLYVSGGGARNKTLMRCLGQIFEKHNVTVATTDTLGIDPDAKEAICFALLAYQTILGRTTNIPGVTGARENVILGKICPVQKQM